MYYTFYQVQIQYSLLIMKKTLVVNLVVCHVIIDTQTLLLLIMSFFIFIKPQ